MAQSHGFLRVFTVCALGLLLLASTALAAGVPGMPKSARKAPPPLEEPKSPEDVPAFMASLTDEQARRLLQAKLSAHASQGENEEQAPRVNPVLSLFLRLEASIRSSVSGLARMLALAREELASDTLMENLNGGAGAGGLARTLLVLSAVCSAALAACLAAARAGDAALARAARGGVSVNLGRAGLALGNALLGLAAVAVFFFAGFALFMVFGPAQSPGKDMGAVAVSALTTFLLVQALARTLLSPACHRARPIPLEDRPALTLYRWLTAIAMASTVVASVSVILSRIGGATALGAVVYAQAGPLTSALLTAMILANRKAVARAISGGDDLPARSVRVLAARFWHVAAIVYAVAIGFFWSAQALSHDATVLSLVLSLFLIPCCIGLDLWMGRLMLVASGQDREVIDLNPEAASSHQQRGLGERDEERSFRQYAPLIRKALRAALVGFAAFAMFRAWGVDIPLGWFFARNVLTAVLATVGGLLLWEIVRIRIDRRLREEPGMPGEEMEEGGGAGGSRSATLLMLLRKFLLGVIVVLGSLVTLSSLGVDIGPLIAGAGVVGLAIGFGAQTLVKDIISGVFFLIDDAFRVGDYIEAGTAKGTVEQISLRSMKLRHPRGMVFTIPYGGLKILQNYSRDYIISKLDFRVRYDADIEKIRKIIKRINKELQANEEISKGMLSDIKSMGVRKMEDSAMILRIKFKTIPGHQFLVEKELYRRVQEAFRQNGIEFAHRNVTVYLPPEFKAPGGDKPIDGAAAHALGAAAADVLAEEEERMRAAAKAQKPKTE